MKSIISLQETSQNHWRAKYQGNYGVYTIKITTDGKHTTEFSCSCPSDYYPCKHISMIETAIAERVAKNKKLKTTKIVKPEDLLKDLTREELYDFIVKQLQYLPELCDNVILEFSHRINAGKGNKYSPILRNALENFDFDEGYEYENWLDVDILDQWLDKARSYIKKKNYREAVLIAKACIEEFSRWLCDSDSDIIDWIPDYYLSDPFDILKEAAANPEVNNKELFDYCMAEMDDEKYAHAPFYDGFNDLLKHLGKTVDPEGFIALQEQLLSREQDKGSRAAEKILQREIDFYRSMHKPQRAWALIEQNIQIQSFRKEVVHRKITDKQYGEAKKLVQEFLNGREGDYHRPGEWEDFLLEIAGKEKDSTAIRKTSFLFIKDFFNEKYYRIYKAAFTEEEWPEEMENLIQHYEGKKDWFNDSLANLLAAEKEAERLMDYNEKHLAADKMSAYHKYFADEFPEKTLALFRKAVDHYAEKNVGRSCYGQIAQWLKMMKKIKGGTKVVAEMIGQYQIQYKNRRVMMSVLGAL
ncbi:hypothetical protein FACS1894147_04650 [Spirochaetia bacterium]|nr:hypothetical protein FACS1894147_04650 [Spirochaetia bacterium]